MFARLFLLFIIIPLVDLMLLVWLAKYTGIPLTIGLVILTAAIGAYLVKLQGAEVRRKIFEQFSKQQMPSDLLSDGAMIMFAAGLLLTPGLLTDCLGFTLLTPVCRSFYKKRFGQWLKKNFRFQVIQPTASQGGPQDDNTVDGHVVPKKPVVVDPERIEEQS